MSGGAQNRVWDVVVVGSGPASLTAAIYTTRGSCSTLILGGEVWGGQLMLTTTVENYPGFPDGVQGPDLMGLMRRQAERFGAEFIEANCDGVNFSPVAGAPFELTSSGQTYFARTVIIATGAETKWLGVKGERELIGRGVSSCAPCDAPFFKGKKVAVVGGGDSAMEEALVLSKFSSEVTIIHRRDQFRSSDIMERRVLGDPKIRVLWNTEIIEIVGKDRLEKLMLKNNKDNSVFDFVVDGVFVAIGHVPSSQIFQNKLELDEKGFVKRIPNGKFQMSTSVQGIFVAGDVHDDHYKQAVTAAGFGCMAAMEAITYLDNLPKIQENG